jgi:hypothetical protein
MRVPICVLCFLVFAATAANYSASYSGCIRFR